jgi:hypothetical protein
MRDFIYYAEEDLAYNIDAFLKASKLQKINSTGNINVQYSFLLELERQKDDQIQSYTSTNQTGDSSEEA